MSAFIKICLKQACYIILFSIILAGAVNWSRSSPLALVGDWSAEARVSAKTGEDIIITLEEAKALHESKQAIFLDARPDIWFEVGHISGARSLPFENFLEASPKVLADIKPDAALITYCDGETCELSHDLAAALMEKGFTNVRVLINGWTLWNQKGYPIEEESR